MLNLLTFAKLAKSVKVTGQSKKSKQIRAERNNGASHQFGECAELEHHISMESKLSFSLGPAPWTLATDDRPGKEPQV